MLELRRRDFITLLGGAAAPWPLAARAQQPRTVPVIGFLHSGSAEPYAGRLAAFRQGLSDTGIVEGKDFAIESRWAEGNYERLRGMAGDLVARDVLQQVVLLPRQWPRQRQRKFPSCS